MADDEAKAVPGRQFTFYHSNWDTYCVENSVWNTVILSLFFIHGSDSVKLRVPETGKNVPFPNGSIDKFGSVGMEGALEGMKTGYCDLNWAREHHDWWAQRCEDEGKVLSREQVTASVADTASRSLPAGQTAGESVS